MRTENVLISFVVTVYNLERYIARCLDSILSQDFDNYEIVVVDNSSTDKSVAICEAYAEKYSDKIVFLKMPVKYSAHGVGLGVARGKYVQIVDGDDQLTEGSVKEIAEIIEKKEPDIILSTYRTLLEDEENNVNNMLDARFDTDFINNSSYKETLEYLGSLPSFHSFFWRYVFKKDLFKPVKLLSLLLFIYEYRVWFKGDELSSIKLLCQGNSIYCYEKPLIIYTRRSDGSGCGAIRKKKFPSGLFLTVLEVMYYIFRSGRKGYKLNYCLARLDYILELFTNSLNAASEREISLIARYIDENIALIKEVNKNKLKSLNMLCAHIDKFGSREGLKCLMSAENRDFLEKIRLSGAKSVVVFPSGNKAFSTVKLLGDNGVGVSCFIDNDASKDNHFIGGLPCFTPANYISDNRNIKEKTFVISTGYTRLADELKRQLLDLNIRENQIIVK